MGSTPRRSLSGSATLARARAHVPAGATDDAEEDEGDGDPRWTSPTEETPGGGAAEGGRTRGRKCGCLLSVGPGGEVAAAAAGG